MLLHRAFPFPEVKKVVIQLAYDREEDGGMSVSIVRISDPEVLMSFFYYAD